LLHVRSASVRRWVQRLLPGRLRTVVRDARVRLLGRDLRYPFQANLHGLPADLKAHCLLEYLQAVTAAGRETPRNFPDWVLSTFGRGMYDAFFAPYNRKLWTLPPEQLTTEWLGPYVPRPEVERVLRGAFEDIPAGGGYNAEFLYLRQGGIGQLADALARPLTSLCLNAAAVGLDPRRRTVDIAGVGRLSWRNLISTLPLPKLIGLLAHPPRKVKEAAQRLRNNSVVVVNLGVRRTRLHPAHWIYFPEPDYCFHRVGFPSNYGRVSPPGRSALYAEVAYPAGKGRAQPRVISRRVRQDLIRAKILRPEDKIEVEHLQYLPYAYVIFNRDYSEARKLLLTYLETQGIQSIGRWGGWEYSAMENALLAGGQAARQALKKA
jgi:protoporphyrinogen oxidase